ncbi:MAG: hypothetical protein H6737_16675 [Alphaproteobacteria bacterium]|nr:hypothetical protein [Alphaproteobacteria bacterium]
MIALLLSGIASATVPDLYGLGARFSGAGGGGIALVDDGTAAYMNPAGLFYVRRPHAGIGFGVGLHRFDPIPGLYWDTNRDGSLNELDAPLQVEASTAPATGLHVEAGRNVGGKFGLGFSAYIPTNTLILFEMFEPSLPAYFMYDNRLQRFVAAGGVGGEILPGISVGASIDVLAKADVDVRMTIDATLVGPQPEDEDLEDLVGEINVDTHHLALRVKPAFAPVFGIQIHPGAWVPALEGLALGATFHGAAGFDVNTEIDLQANVNVVDVGDLDPFVTALVVQANLAMLDHYVPPRITIGAAYSRADTFSVYADGRWSDWRRLVLNVARVKDATINSPLVDIDENITDGNAYGLLVRPVWAVRAGTELHLPKWTFDTSWRYLRLTARGGVGYEQSPLIQQGADTSVLDSDRTTFTLGAGAEFWDPFELVDGAVRIDAFFQSHQLARRALDRQTDTPRAGYPVEGGVIPIGGNILVFGAQWSFDY